jgi:hypothetical protein
MERPLYRQQLLGPARYEFASPLRGLRKLNRGPNVGRLINAPAVDEFDAT